MANSDLIEKCTSLNLKAFTQHMDSVLEKTAQKNWSISETLEHLIDLELERRQQSRIELRFRQSKLAEKLTIDMFDFGHHSSRKKQKAKILNLLSLEFLKEHMDIISIGNPGTGKTFLAKCIGYRATQAGVKVLFTSAIDMINHLIAAQADHSLLKKLTFYQSPELLITDELGYLSLGTQGSDLFFQVISARHKVKSTVITTNLPFAEWGKIFDSITAAAAIADRLVYRSEILVMEGESYRKRARKLQNRNQN